MKYKVNKEIKIARCKLKVGDIVHATIKKSIVEVINKRLPKLTFVFSKKAFDWYISNDYLVEMKE